MVQVRFEETASWLTPSGVARKRRLLESKGLPDFKGWRFVTLTLDPAFFGYCPLTGYLEGKDHIRRFLEAGRVSGLWDRETSWCWKMEFQKNGWAHWHLLIDRKRKFNFSELRKIHDIWGLGRTNVRRISKSKFGYQFKYAFKGVYQDDGSGLCVPQWFLDYYQPSEDGKKPKSFARVRFWQTCKGFYTGKPAPVRERSLRRSSILPRPVAQVLDERSRSFRVIARKQNASYQKSTRLFLSVSHEYFFRVHLWDAENGAGCTLSARSFAMDPETVNKITETNQRWKLQQVLSQNRLSLKKALWLRANRKDLATC